MVWDHGVAGSSPVTPTRRIAAYYERSEFRISIAYNRELFFIKSLGFPDCKSCENFNFTPSSSKSKKVKIFGFLNFLLFATQRSSPHSPCFPPHLKLKYPHERTHCPPQHRQKNRRQSHRDWCSQQARPPKNGITKSLATNSSQLPQQRHLHLRPLRAGRSPPRPSLARTASPTQGPTSGKSQNYI